MFMLSRSYGAPSGKVGQQFVEALVEELRGVQDIQCNLERFVIFHTVILQRSQHVNASHEIRRWIDKSIDAWEAGQHGMLV